MDKNDFRVTSIFKIIIRICIKNVEFCRKTSKFLPKRCLLIFCILYWTEKKLNQQVCLIKHVEKEICNSTSHKKRARRRSKNIIQLQKHFQNSWKVPLVTLVTSYHKSSLLIWKTKIGVKFWILLMLLQVNYIFIASAKDLYVLQISTEN